MVPAEIIGETYFWTRSRLYRTGTLRRWANCRVESTVISLPAALRNAFVHASLRGLRFILKFLWHFERQKRNCLASFRMNVMPCKMKASFVSAGLDSLSTPLLLALSSPPRDHVENAGKNPHLAGVRRSATKVASLDSDHCRDFFLQINTCRKEVGLCCRVFVQRELAGGFALFSAGTKSLSVIQHRLDQNFWRRPLPTFPIDSWEGVGQGARWAGPEHVFGPISLAGGKTQLSGPCHSQGPCVKKFIGPSRAPLLKSTRPPDPRYRDRGIFSSINEKPTHQTTMASTLAIGAGVAVAAFLVRDFRLTNAQDHNEPPTDPDVNRAERESSHGGDRAAA